MMIGKTLAHYEILGLLGKGGMGEVYRAHDQKLGRDVALKILPREMSGDPERLARFDREARTLATLQHPNVASAYGLEETPGARFLVMELVEGEGLDDLIARGPLEPEVVRRMGAQIASGLEAAHDKGIIHRDLKPANIRVMPDGTVKVLDFGLAKAWSEGTREADISNSPTMTAMATIQGVILGTAGYMSPEQARGQMVNKQTDIWAFGVILWEMLTGKRLFEGATVSDVMAGVLRADIGERDLPPNTPAALRRLLRRCLERDLKLRLRDIGDAALELTGDEDPGDEAAGVGGNRPSKAGPFSLPVWLTILAVAVLGSGLATWMTLKTSATDQAAAPVPGFEQKTFGDQVIFNARFLPDGQGIVYSGANFGNTPNLYFLSPGAMAPRRIGPEKTTLLSVSATGELAVLTGAEYRNHRVLTGTLARMMVDGSPRQLIDQVRDADWGPDGELAIIRRVGGIDHLEYPVGNVLYETSGYVSDPRISPDGKQVAFHDHQWWLDDRGWLKVVDESGQVTTLSEEFWAIQGVVWTADQSKILFAGARGTSKLVPLVADIATGQTRPFLGLPNPTTILDLDARGHLLTLSETSAYGVVAHPGGSDEEFDLTWLNNCWGPVLAPDNRTLIFTNGRGGANYSVVTRTIDGAPPTTLGEGGFLDLSPDGAWVNAQIANPAGIGVYPTGTGTARVLDPGPIVQFHHAYWFPDNEHLLIVGNEADGPVRCYRQAISGGVPEPLEIEGAKSFDQLTLDGKAILGQDEDLNWSLYPLDGGPATPLPGLRTDDEIKGWNPEGTAVYVTKFRQVPIAMTRVDLATQERTPFMTIGPEKEPGLLWLDTQFRVFDPAKGYAYGYLKGLSQLFLVEDARW